jgi:hypothetical protein
VPINKLKQTPWSDSGSELYRPSDRRLSVKSVATFAARGCHIVGVTDPFGRILNVPGRINVPIHGTILLYHC